MGVIDGMLRHGDIKRWIGWGYMKETLEDVKRRIVSIPDDNVLYEAQKEYIEFLQNYVNGVSGYLSVHGMRSSKEDIVKGESLRKRISELSPPPTPNQE